MKIVVTESEKRKTTELIKLCSKNRYSLIVCHNRQSADLVFRQAKEMGLSIPLPITYSDFMEHRYAGQNIDTLLLDNAELFLQSLTPVRIEAISMSSE